MPSVMTQELIGYAILSISTGNSVVLLLQVRSTEAYVEKDTCTTRLGLRAGLPGRETILFPSVATVDHCYGFDVLSSVEGFCLEDIVVAILSLLEIEILWNISYFETLHSKLRHLCFLSLP